jgi:hypothetical protein
MQFNILTRDFFEGTVDGYQRPKTGVANKCLIESRTRGTRYVMGTKELNYTAK